MIPERLIDLTTAFAKKNKRHTVYTHLGCVSLRILLGTSIYYKISIFKNYNFLMFFYIIILIAFGNKLLITENKSWKVYARTLIFYSLSIIINTIDKYKYNIFNKQPRNLTGLFIILDAIMGLQSRHIQNNFKD
jgi:hypothetical protein